MDTRGENGSKTISIKRFKKDTKKMKISTYTITLNDLFWQGTIEQTIESALTFADEVIVVDANHELAGKRMKFKLFVREIL